MDRGSAGGSPIDWDRRSAGTVCGDLSKGSDDLSGMYRNRMILL